MPNYRFYRSADIQQDRIWHYTHEEWGKRQADKYILGLHKHLQKLSERKAFWNILPEQLVTPVGAKLQVYFSHHEKHVIFFRELDHAFIGIISLLHEAMDIPFNLKQDLQAISLFLKQVELHKGLPLDLKIPNAETIAAMRELDSENKSATYNVDEYSLRLQQLKKKHSSKNKKK